MKAREPDSNARKADLKQAIEDVKQTSPRQHEVEEAAARVWARVSESAEAIQQAAMTADQPATLGSCEDYRALIRPYLEGDLGRARVLLLEDHASECLGCRKAIAQARRPESSKPVLVRVGGAGAVNWAWAGAGLAAVLLVGFLAGGGGIVRQILFPLDVSASVDTIRGRLFRIDGQDLVAVQPGELIAAGERIRTAKDSGAMIELSDGSRVEMRERSEFRVLPASDGIRVQLERGSVIVEAAEQDTGHLYLSTDDVDVSVVGTVFSASEGVKGARISVIEGEVRVAQGSETVALFPGQQFNSSQALTEVPIEQEIAWSESSNEHLTLMLELAGMSEELIVAIESPSLRYSSMLLDLVPSDTVVYVAFPNVAQSISTAYDVFTTRIRENPITADWWNQLNVPVEGTLEIPAETLETLMGYLRSFADQIGDEVVVAFGDGEPVLLAEVQNPDLVADVLRGIAALSTDEMGLQVLVGPDAVLAYDWPTPLRFAYIDGALLAFSPSHQALLDVASAQSGGSGFQTRNFYQSLAAIYTEGADWLFAADLQTIVTEIYQSIDATDAEELGLASLIGFDSLAGLFVDYKSIDGQATTRAAVTFSQERTGIASWIAEPGPMGGLDFVSPDALAVTSSLTRDVGSIVAEIFTSFQSFSPEAWSEIVKFQQEHRFDLQYDLASALGGEFVVAMDGPLLPTPGWKAVIEVYNWATLQNAIQRMVAEFNLVSAVEGGSQLEVQAESTAGGIYYTLRQTDGGPEIHYTFIGGYMVLGPSQALVNQSVQYYEAQTGIANSLEFRSLMPAGGQNYCSTIMYQNVGGLTASLSSFLRGSAELDAGQLDVIGDLVSETPAMLGCVIAEQNRIIAINEGDSPLSILSLGGIATLMEQFTSVVE